MKAQNTDGMWYVTRKNRDGSISMGFAPSLAEAWLYCIEMIREGQPA